MSHVRGKRLIPVALTLGALCFASAAVTPVIAQGTNSIHVEITDGPDAGTYDLITSEPCQAGYLGPKDWGILVYDTGENPDTIELMISADNPDSNFVSLQLVTDDGMFGTLDQMMPTAPREATVDDRGDTATLTLVTEVLGASGEGNGITAGISTTVECGAIQRLQESPAPVASLGPSPSLEPAASGSEAHRST